MTSTALTSLEQKFIDSVALASHLCGLTQTDIGAAIGVTHAQVSQRQNGRTRYTVRDMHRIGVLFDVDPLRMAAGLDDWLGEIDRAAVRARAGAFARSAASLRVPEQPIAPTG